MPKIKLTKGELKKQRDNLRQYNRYLPTLQLKKQQLQIEILRQKMLIEEKKAAAHTKYNDSLIWAGLLADREIDVKAYVKPAKIQTSYKNIAGVDVPLFGGAEFGPADYDLFLTPLWVDAAVDALRAIAALRAEVKMLEEGTVILRRELRTTSQRVNLFEKVKIPESEEAVRQIKIFIGDQMTNAVGRSKIAKKKIEAAVFEEVSA